MAETVKRVRRTPDEARRLILNVAQAAIARTGPEGLRLHDIAVAAGISHPLILHHFGSRAGLVRALTREATAELKDKLVAAMTERDYSIEEQLDRVFDAFRNGLGQRLAWLATVDSDGDQSGSAMIQRETPISPTLNPLAQAEINWSQPDSAARPRRIPALRCLQASLTAAELPCRPPPRRHRRRRTRL